MMGWGWGSGWGWHGAGLFAVLHVFWWVLIVVAVIALIRLAAGGRGQRWRSEDPALEILRARYARGEIDKAEFEQRKHDLVR